MLTLVGIRVVWCMGILMGIAVRSFIGVLVGLAVGFVCALVCIAIYSACFFVAQSVSNNSLFCEFFMC